MAVRDHEQHHNAADERVRLAAIARHEQEIRDRERARWLTRVDACLNTSGTPADDWPGCVD